MHTGGDQKNMQVWQVAQDLFRFFAELRTFFGPSRMASVKIIVIEMKIEKWQLCLHVSAHVRIFFFQSFFPVCNIYIYNIYNC